MKNIRIKFFSSAVLKYIAMVTMIIDHIGASGLIFLMFSPLTAVRLYHISRMIGRVSFPIFLFLIVEGFVHTKDIKKYIIRLTIFAVLSEVPFDLAFWGGVVNIQHQNVMWSLLISVIMLYFMKKYRDFSVVFAGIACAIAWGIKCDYEYYGPLAVACMYLLRERTLYKNIATALIFSFEPAAIFALIPINMYNGEKGRSLKYLFYFFYPVHLLILVFLRNMLR